MLRLRTATTRSRTGRGRNDRGAVAILTAALIPVLILLTALAVDVGRWYVEAARVQKAADAAALGGVTWLPQDPLSATAGAKAVSADNGYTDGVNSVTVTPYIGDKPSELYVTVSSTVRNLFGAIFGNPTTTIARTALADFTAPAIMGSPCNAIGNQPDSTSGAPAPVGTVIPTVAEGGYAACQTPAGFWLNMAGPVTDKVRGDRYATRTNCSSGVFGCTSGTNDEYKPDGYFFVVRVSAAAVNQPITLQAYDPAFVQVGDTCTAGPTNTTDSQSKTVNILSGSKSGNTVTLTFASAHGFANGSSITVAGAGSRFNTTANITSVPSATTLTYSYNGGSGSTTTTTGTVTGTTTVTYNMVNPYSVDATTAAARYATDTNASTDAQKYCPGDATQNAGTYLNTSFVLRQQTDTYNPLKAPVQQGSNVGGSGQSRDCAVQFGSQFTGPTSKQLTNGSSTYDSGLARVFHQWVTLCTFTPTREGDYYLQVRTNVPLTGSTAIDSMSYLPSSGSAITTPGSVDNAGGGHNRFAVRAYVPGQVTVGGSTVNTSSQVAVSGWERMPIYANQKDVTATFNLIQVLPNAAGSAFTFSAYDGGDGDCSGGGCTVQVQLPLDAYSTTGGGISMGTCTGVLSDGSTNTNQGTLPNCKVSVQGDNGKLQTITVQVPTNYGCVQQSSGGCWYRVLVTYGGGVTDTTTWDATIGGDPVRLLK